ncbi:hypothetical protein OEZ86_004472 [Tetradesmus obliquus]|nr:hypothetical protein OEZ86_004472 [Tetradesmus obliquus]
MAHLFLKHGLQKLPSVSKLCSEAAAALAAAHEALEKGGAGSSSSGSGEGDHPKLACLKALLTKLKAAKPGCKVLLVRKLPQDPSAALQLLATALLSLSMSYQRLYFILELPEQQLAAVLQGSAQLQGLAAAAGVKLTLLCSYTAANTQDMAVAVCKASLCGC